MTERIIITDTNLGDSSIEHSVLDADFDVTVENVLTEDAVIEVAAGAAGLLVQWAPITERVLTALAPQGLRAITRYGIGLDNIDLDAAAKLGVTVRNVDDYCLNEVADHAVASIYAHNRRLTVGSRVVASDGWTTAGITRPLPPSADPVGLAGYGRIGRAAAARVAALGFPLHIWDPYVTDAPDGVTQHSTLLELATAVNHLSLHVPTIAETRGLITAEVLAALGPDGHLVNTARGALVDEEALLAALNNRTLGFASLDVLSSEPPTGVAAQLATHPHALITPHIAYLSTESLPMLQRRAAEILRDALTTESR